MKKEFRGSSWRMGDAFWRAIEPLLPKYAESAQGGRPRADRRKTMDGIFFVLRTGVQWKSLPREYGSLAWGRGLLQAIVCRRVAAD